MKMYPFVLMAVAGLWSGTAPAAETAWTEIAEGARLRAVSAGIKMDGRALVGLELELGPGLKTYWRVPGETGIPMSVGIADAEGPRDAELFWPLPERDLSQGFVDFVYHDDLVLPALVAAHAGDPLMLDVQMGVCSDICVPVRARLALPGDQRPDAANSLRLRQALAQTPMPWQGEDAPLTDIRFDTLNGEVTLAYDPLRIDPNRVFPSLDGTNKVFSAPEIDAAANRLHFTLLVRKDDATWHGRALRLTFSTDAGPYDIVRSKQTR